MGLCSPAVSDVSFYNPSLSPSHRRVRAGQGRLWWVLFLPVCQKGRVDFQPVLREDVLLHPPTQKGKMIVEESTRGGRAALAVGLPALYSRCDRDGVHCFEVKTGRRDFCVLCGLFTPPAGQCQDLPGP